MSENTDLPVKLKTIYRSSLTVTRRDIARHSNIHPRMIECLVDLGLIEPVGTDARDGELVFRRETVGRIEKIARLRRHLGINYSGIAVVLELLSRIEELEERLRELEGSRISSPEDS